MKKRALILGIFLIVACSNALADNEKIRFKNNTGMEDINLQIKWYTPAEGGALHERWGNITGSDTPEHALGFAIFTTGNVQKQISRQEELIPGVSAYELHCDGPSIYSKQAGMHYCIIKAQPVSSEGVPNIGLLDEKIASEEGIPSV